MHVVGFKELHKKTNTHTPLQTYYSLTFKDITKADSKPLKKNSKVKNSLTYNSQV